MKKSALVIVLAWAVSVNVLVAQGQRTRTETYDPAKHHQDVTLRVTADAPATFTLPTSNSPIRLDLSAMAFGSTTGQQPSPILRSATVLHASLADSIYLTDGSGPALTIGQSGIQFTNQPGPDGVRVTISIGRSSKGVPKQLEISSADPTQDFTLIEVRISLWY